MSYSEIKRDALVYRRRAIKKDIPVAFLNLADRYFNKAVYVREVASKEKVMKHSYYYNRGIEELLKALEIYRCHYFNNQSGLNTQHIEKRKCYGKVKDVNLVLIRKKVS